MRNPNIPQPQEHLLPEAEREDCQHIAWLLKILNSHRSKFTAALNLMMESNEAKAGRKSAIQPIDREVYNTPDFELKPHSKMASQWSDIAMKDAALTTYHFGRTLDGLIKAAWKCPTLLETIDLDKLNSAQPLFEKYFPKAARMRTAVAHLGDVSHSRLSLEKARYPGELEVGGMILKGMAGGTVVHGWNMHMTIKNDLVTVEVSPTKHAQLIEIVDTVYDAFRAHRPKSPEASGPNQSDEIDRQ